MAVRIPPSPVPLNIEHRSLSTIAAEIRKDWKPVYFGAEPYLNAMFQLDKITDHYGNDPGYGVVAYFLSNSKTWRGETAKRVKAELNKMLKNR